MTIGRRLDTVQAAPLAWLSGIVLDADLNKTVCETPIGKVCNAAFVRCWMTLARLRFLP